MGISEDDYRALRIIVLDSYRQIKVYEDEFDIAAAELKESRIIGAPGSEEKWKVMSQALGQNKRAVVAEAAAKEDFKKLTHNLSQLWRGNNNLSRISPQTPTLKHHSCARAAPGRAAVTKLCNTKLQPPSIPMTFVCSETVRALD